MISGMKYRIIATVFVDPSNETKVMTLYTALKNAKAIFEVINAGKVNEERSRIEIHKCYHDEIPPKPCELIDKVEV